MSSEVVKYVPSPEKEQFFATLRQRVQAYFNQNHIERTANGKMYFKTTTMLFLYFLPIVLIYLNILPFWAMWLCYLLMGVGVVGIGMGVMHDAIHNSYSSKTWVNKLLGYTMNLVGGSNFTWKVQHNHLHHTYTNVPGHDEDINNKPILRLAPTGEWRPIHRFQHWYALFLYGFLTISWVTAGDFEQLVRYTKRGLTRELGHSVAWEATKLIATKAVYWTFILFIPMFALDYAWWQVLIGFFAMHFMAGFVLALVFQLAHVVKDTQYTFPDENGNIDNSWAINQLMTTANFARNNRFISWWIGGLNFQIEHHLLPQICHVHYPKLAPIVKQTAEEFGLPYYEYKSMWAAIKSHLARLKELGARPSLA